MATNLGYRGQVRFLYKTILRLHRGLPLPELRMVGDAYVREEFKTHKTVGPAEAKIFMEAWAKYAIDLSKQLHLKGPTGGEVGSSMDEEELSAFSDEQVLQLYELYKETSKPIVEDSKS